MDPHRDFLRLSHFWTSHLNICPLRTLWLCPDASLISLDSGETSQPWTTTVQGLTADLPLMGVPSTLAAKYPIPGNTASHRPLYIPLFLAPFWQGPAARKKIHCAANHPQWAWRSRAPY